MSDTWQQVLAALLAAVIPVAVKFLNDLADRLQQPPKPAPAQPEPPEPPAQP